MRNASRIQFFDTLKGLCAILIIITHYAWSDGERLAMLFPFWIGMAVPVFLIISGYVLSNSFAQHKITTMEEAYRFETILPKLIRYTVPFLIVYLVELLYLITKGAFPGVLGSAYLFLRGACGPGGYYYPVLLQLVLVFPVIHFVIKKAPGRGLLLCFLVNAAFELLKNAYWVNEDCYRLLIFRYLFLVAFGCYLFFHPEGLRGKHCLLSFGIGLVYLVGISYLNYSPGITQFWPETSFIAALYIVPIFQLLWRYCKNCRVPGLTLLGKASYHIYLVQMVYYYLCADYVYLRIPDRKVQLLVSIAACVSVGILFYCLESPITNKLLRVFISKLNTWV